MPDSTDDLIIQVTVGMWRALTDRIESLEALLPAAEPTKRTKRGTRLPEGWVPDQQAVSKMMMELHVGDTALLNEHRKFCDYYYSVPGQKGVKIDWDRAWCNWMRSASERGSLRTRGTVADKPRGWMELDVAEG